jgi:hypothetical protein
VIGATRGAVSPDDLAQWKLRADGGASTRLKEYISLTHRIAVSPTLERIRVSHPDLEQALQSAGFEKYLPDPPTPRVALRRALSEWIKTKQRIARTLQLQLGDEDQDENGGGHRRTLIRVIDRAGSDHLVYALVAEDIDFSALGLAYGTALSILLNKKTGEMICTTDAEGVIDAQRESQQLIDELMPYWWQYRDLFIARDLSQMVREIIGGMVTPRPLALATASRSSPRRRETVARIPMACILPKTSEVFCQDIFHSTSLI